MSDDTVKSIIRALQDVPPKRLKSVLKYVSRQQIGTSDGRFRFGGFYAPDDPCDEVEKAEARRKIAPYQTVTVGGVTVTELLDTAIHSKESAKRCVIGDARDIITSPKFQVSSSCSSVSFVELTPGELGFKRCPSMDMVMTKEFCARWSQAKLDSCAIDLCEPEDAIQLLIQYRGAPKGAVALFSMPSQVDPHGFKCIFRVSGRDESLIILDTVCCHPKRTFGLDDYLVFRLVQR
jgi:hypothetical protein